MRGPGQSEVSACGNGSRPGCAARRSDPPVNAMSLSSRRKVSVQGTRNINIRKAERIEKKKKPHDEIDVLDIGVSLEFERELVKVPYTHLGLVCASGDGMVAVARALDADAGLGELKVLYELYGTLDLFANGALSLGLGCAFAHEPIWEGRGGSSGCAIDRVHLDHRIYFSYFISTNSFSHHLVSRENYQKSCIHKNDIQVVQ